MGVTLDNDDGSFSDITFNDNPQNRAMFAIRDQFGDKWQSVMMRVWAFADICDHPDMDEFRWTPEGEASAKIDDAVIEIASVMPLNPKALFNAKTFFKRARDIMYARPEEAGA